MAIKRKLLAIIVCVLMLLNIVGCAECEHKWGNFKTLSQATCTKEGEKQRTCELCGEVNTFSLPLESHKWRNASCTAPKTCKVCSLTEGEPLEHIFNKQVQKPTALKTESTAENPVTVYYKSCSCGLVGDTETFEIKMMTGKNILIFGDSYSSYIGTIPDGYRVYYNGSNILYSQEQMWWSLLVDERGGNIVRNDSSSGSTINTAGYHSFIGRLDKLYSDGFFTNNRIDYVFVLGGTNDNSSTNLGEEMFSGWTSDNLKQVLPAIGYFFVRLREILPDAEIYGLINKPKLKTEIQTAITNVCNYINGKVVKLNNIALESSHPTELGMMAIKDQILKVFDK